MATEAERAAQWIVGRDTGSSSKALWAVMMGVKGGKDYPLDGGDFGRCYRLLQAVPEWRQRIGEMAAVSQYWKALVAHWDELEALHRDQPDKLYERLKTIRTPLEDADPLVVRIKGGMIRTGA
jgi:hypothetical protein